MILIKERFLSADHIQHIYIKSMSGSERYSVIVQMTGCYAEFGIDDYLDNEMAFELRRRIVTAISDYKSSNPPAIQQVDFPRYEEVHPEAEKS